MAREMYLVGVNKEELQPAPKAEPPRTPKSKWENFWYHYKWPFWSGVFIVAVVLILLVQSITNNPPDYDMVLVTKYNTPDATVTALEDSLAAYGQDIDGDGEVEVHITNCYLSEPDTNVNTTFYQVLQTRFLSGEFSLFIWEPQFYDEFAENIANATSEGFELFAQIPAESALIENGRVWNWASGTKREENVALKKLPEELYFTVRTPGGLAEDTEIQHQQAMALLTAYITDESK